MAENDLHFPGWQVAAACCVGIFFATVPLGSFAVFLGPLTAQFGWSRQDASSAYGMLTLTAALSAPLVGVAIDRLGARRIIISGLAVSAVALASLSTLNGSLWQFRLTFGVLGVTTMSSSPIAHSRVVFGWFDRYRGRALAVMLSGAAISNIVTPIVSDAVIRSAGWRLAWLMIGSTTALVGCSVAWRIREHPTARSSASTDRTSDVSQALRSRAFWTLAAVMFCGTASMNAAVVHLVALLVDRGVPAAQATLALSTMGAASLAGRLASGWMLDRFAAPRVSVLLLTIAAIGTWILAVAPSLGLGVLAAACIGFGSGGEVDVTPYLLSRYFGLRSLATLYGFSWTAWGLAGAIAPLWLGRAFDTTGSYTLALAFLGIVTMTAALLMMTLPALPVLTPIVRR